MAQTHPESERGARIAYAGEDVEPAPGEAFIWSSKATDDAFTKSAVKIPCRPRVTHHGGATKTAVAGQRERLQPPGDVE